MSDALRDVGLNLLADVIFLIAILLIGWVLYALSRRSTLMSFFAVKRSKRLTVYLSDLSVRPFGAAGVGNQPISYQGSVVAYGEMLAASEFRELFVSPFPSFGEKPGILSNIFISSTTVLLQPAPSTRQQVERSASILCLGSPVANTASAYVETSLQPRATFQLGPSPAIAVQGLSPITQTTYGFVERIVDPQVSRGVFYAAGLSELGTVGATHYLATQWPRLWRKYRDREFLIMLDIDPSDFRRAAVVFEK